MTCTLTIDGPTPSKKNNYRGGRGNFFVRPEVKQRLVQMQLQAQSAWGGRPTLSRVHLYKATFYASNSGQDLDGMNTTVLDVLQKAGVLANDNINRVPCQHAEAKIVPKGQERVVVELEV